MVSGLLCAQCLEHSYTFAPGMARVAIEMYETDQMDPKTVEDAKKLGAVLYDIPEFVDIKKAQVKQKYYFGLTAIRVEMVFENPNGKDVVETLVIDHDYHGN